MAEDKTIGINVKTNVDQTQQQFNDLRQRLRETNEEIANLDKNSETFDIDLKNLNRTLDSLNGSYDSLSKNNTDLGATFEDVHGEIMPMMSVAGELEDRMYELARAGKQNSKEFNDLKNFNSNKENKNIFNKKILKNNNLIKTKLKKLLKIG